ncbi:molybdenum cofactor biosynthesis protein MoaE [Leeia sp. TBRC 13508]|uniref:Molybdopterin synthase catalytic subunit n=1 Tax=Leeia speluncae TaxID=2884804 RepID=A0ABS8D9U8_9NEIS|nr:molybdenum cofactor biosynthesis protein MoaE [Leeia speluncae]MCB6184383.1 molybdenum cofactor biosynthesis protein MoaE [Leeia speluncae]
MISIRVEAADFNIAEEQKLLLSRVSATGAVVAFTGVVREFVKDQRLISMMLEHYPGMTEKALFAIAEQAKSRWDLSAITIIHRIGHLHANEQIVLVLVSSMHRGEAFSGCEFIMDYLKTEAPFWKKEFFETGESNWVDARHSDDLAKHRWQ